MPLYLLQRAALAIATMLLVSVIVFLLVHASPTTPGTVAIGIGGTPEQVAEYDRSIGWHDPLIEQYLRWLGATLTGDFGTSLTDGRSVADDIAQKLPVTAALAAGATLLSAIVGILAGVVAAVRGGWVDRLVSAVAGVVASIPVFWLGIVLVFLLAVEAGVFPSSGYVPFEQNPAAWANSLALPVISLAAGGAAFIARQTRASMREALAQDHIRTLRASGMPRARILYVHALRYAALPIAASIALQFIALFGGSVIIEQLFAMPGLGFATQAAVGLADAPSVQALVVVATLVVVAANLALEFAVRFLDPKLRTA